MKVINKIVNILRIPFKLIYQVGSSPIKFVYNKIDQFKNVFCNQYSTIVMDFNDNFILFGSNNYKQLFVEHDDIFVPILMKKDKIKNILNIDSSRIVNVVVIV